MLAQADTKGPGIFNFVLATPAHLVSVVASSSALTSNKGCSDKLMSYTNKGEKGRSVLLVGTLPDGYVCTNPLPQVPTRQSVPTTRKHIPGYLGLPIGIPTLHSIIAPAIARVQTPWLSLH